MQDKQHHPDQAIARGQLRDDLYLHLLPGRETAHFLVLAGSTKVDIVSIAQGEPGLSARSLCQERKRPKTSLPKLHVKSRSTSSIAQRSGVERRAST